MRAPGAAALASMTARRAFVAAAVLIAAVSASHDTQGQQRPRAGPLSPEEALASFDLEPGYRIELVAAEPLVSSPVAIAFDERGRMYVAENRGYPDPLEGLPPSAPRGVVALLEDTDRDGRFDSRSEFATNLTYPNGIMPWDGGVFVTCAPDLLYLKDTNGDGTADIRKVVLTGFAATRTAQIRFSHPTLGLDNWMYLTGGLNGGRVTTPDHPGRPPIEFANSDSRFNPLTQAFELTGGQGQFGLTFDDHGRRFICDNRHPVWHVVLEPRHLKRNAHLAFSTTVHEVSASGAAAAVWPLSADMTTASFIPTLLSTPHAGTFTAASGVHVHRGDALPEGHQGSIFVCESAQNLVQRQVRSATGVTFTSRPARTGGEFLASRDNWFRPVFAANGPDGALYIVDMYRKVIDHPQYVPEGSRALLDFEAGKARGRVYRLAARAWKRGTTPVNLADVNGIELARALEHPNAWWRETAQRLLVERRERGAIPLVRQLAETGRSEVARIHALWTLDGLGALDTTVIIRALRDAAAPVRENAMRLAESRVATSPALLPAVLALVDDADDRVRLHVALALGETSDRRAVPALAALARRDGADIWMRAAIFSAVSDRSHDFLRSFTEMPTPSPIVRAAVMQDLGQVFGAAETPERCLALILEMAASGPELGWQVAAISGMAQGLRARGLAGEGKSALMTLLSAESSQAGLARTRVAQLVSRASALALDDNVDAAARLAAITLLGHTDYASAGRALEQLLTPRQSSQLQLAAVRALTQLPDPHAAPYLLEPQRWTAFTPQVREAVLAALMSEERHMLPLLDAVQGGSIAAMAIGPSRRSRLMTHRNAVIQKRARALFTAVGSADRMQVYERLREAVVKRTGQSEKGRHVYDSRCAVCHAFNGAGGRLGPDLTGVRNQPADALLLHAIVPDYEITPGYEAYLVETRDGRTLFGRLESEAPNSITVRDASSQQHVVLRTDVRSIAASLSSLMPNELERGLSDQELADLIAYLKADAGPQ